MARLVLGIGTSHTPMLSIPGDRWADFGERDRNNDELVFPPDGLLMGYDEALAGHVSADVRGRPRTREVFVEQAERCQRALDELAARLEAAAPDVTIVVTDDQEEWFFEDNMPALAVFWGASAPVIPRPLMRNTDPDTAALIRAGYGDVLMDVPVASTFGRFVLETLADGGFDVAHFTEVQPTYGGRVTSRLPTAAGETQIVRETAPRPMGLPHGVSFVVKRLYDNAPRPILPVFQNTCYPPNVIRPHRAFALGRALAAAVDGWPEDLSVAIVASGGLSHFVVDEELDRTVLEAIGRRDVATLENLPRHRMCSGTSEILNWVTVAGAMHATDLEFDLVDYVAVYRSEAGTGGGWGFGTWHV
jgi:3-O-methylgallate 3,4-dioxygenase